MLRNDLYNPWFAGKDDWGFEILSGDFIGTVLQINTLEFPDEIENIAVDYHIIKKPESLTEESYKSDMFKAVFETIMNDLIKEALDNFKNEQNRNDDSKELDSQ